MAAETGLHTNLMLLPGAEPDFDQRGGGEGLQHPVFTDRVLAAPIVPVALSLHQRPCIPCQAIAPDAALRVRVTVHDRKIDPLDVVPLELRPELLLRTRILCEHDQP